MQNTLTGISFSNLLDALHGVEVEFAANFATTHNAVTDETWAAMMEAQQWLARYCRSVTGEEAGTLKIIDFWRTMDGE